jgi:hypothetical protein
MEYPRVVSAVVEPIGSNTSKVIKHSLDFTTWYESQTDYNQPVDYLMGYRQPVNAINPFPLRWCVGGGAIQGLNVPITLNIEIRLVLKGYFTSILSTSGLSLPGVRKHSQTERL